jgi:hypothetical protein
VLVCQGCNERFTDRVSNKKKFRSESRNRFEVKRKLRGGVGGCKVKGKVGRENKRSFECSFKSTSVTIGLGARGGFGPVFGGAGTSAVIYSGAHGTL